MTHNVSRKLPTVQRDLEWVVQRANEDPLSLLRLYAPEYAERMKPCGPEQWRGPCPWHNGTGPNFSLRRGKGAFCHSDCGDGTDAVGMIQRITKRTRMDTLRELASHYGSPIDFTPPRWQRRPAAPPPLMPDALAPLRADGMIPADARVIHTHLIRDVFTLGSDGMDYLVRRGFDPEWARSYGFRSIESSGDWARAEEALQHAFLPEERGASGVRRLPTYVIGALLLPYRTMDGAGFSWWQLRRFAPPAPQHRYHKLAGFPLSLPFGADALPACAGQEIHLAEGELDAAALLSVGRKAIAVPGAGSRLRPEWLQPLGSAARLIAWFDDDAAGDGAWKRLQDAFNEVHGTVSPLRRIRIRADVGEEKLDAAELLRRRELVGMLEREEGAWK